MKPDLSELERESWAFALAIYAKPGVAEACLDLQHVAIQPCANHTVPYNPAVNELIRRLTPADFFMYLSLNEKITTLYATCPVNFSKNICSVR